MHDFLIKEIINTNIENELIKIGFDKTYTHKAKDKFKYKNLKIFNLTSAQANIIKQTALSVGADCATHKDVITGKAEISDCILAGSASQINKIAQKLSIQPFGLKILAQQLYDFCRDNEERKTKIVGILNITPDSFSDGGKYLEPADAINQLRLLINDGADIIDIGAETTKPYSDPTPVQTQITRLTPILEYIKSNNIGTPISIDTRSAQVAQFAIEYGASIINDVSGLSYDEHMADTIAKNGVKVIIQHSQGSPEDMQKNPHYQNLIDEIYKALNTKINYAVSKGIKQENIIIDPGIGFGKTRDNNFEIINRWQEFKGLGCPVMLGVSRKSLLDMPDADNLEKDIHTLAINSILMREKVDYIRVHNVKLHSKFKDISDKLNPKG